MEEELGTMKIRVLGEIKNEYDERRKKSKVPHMSKRKKGRKQEKEKEKYRVIIVSPVL
jgi:hypothetical protein